MQVDSFNWLCILNITKNKIPIVWTHLNKLMLHPNKINKITSLIVCNENATIYYLKPD